MKNLLIPTLLFLSYCSIGQVNPLLDTADIKRVYKTIESIYNAFEHEDYQEVIRLHEATKESEYYRGHKLLIAVSTSFQVLANQKNSHELRKEYDTLYRRGVKYYGEELMRNGYATDLFTIVDEPPAPIGGRNEFQQYIEREAKYPPLALENKIRGRVYVQFIVNPNGEIVAPTVVKGIHAACDQEAVRLLLEGPKWKPGYQKGKAVHVMTVQNFYFDSKAYKKRLKKKSKD